MPKTRSISGLLRATVRWTLRGLAGLVALLFLVALLGAVWQWRSTVAEHKVLRPAGRLVEVEPGRRIHLVCQGEGSPTVLLEAGAQGWSNQWLRIQPAVAKRTRVCAYDRAGVGWSDPRAGAHDGVAATTDLRRLVELGAIERPFVFVGHSYGGLLARIYYDRYPEDLAGMVLLEPGDPADVIEWAPEPRDGCGVWCAVSATAARVGLIRFFYRGKLQNPGYPDGFRDELVARFSQPQVAAAFTADLLELATTARQAAENRSLGELPLRVLVSSNPDEAGTSFESEEERLLWIASYRAFWDRMAASSSAGAPPVLVPESNHITMVLLEEPADRVAQTVLSVVEQVRVVGSTPAAEVRG